MKVPPSKLFTNHILPARLFHAGNLALVRQLPEADTADAELSEVSVRPAADFTSVVCA